MEEVAGVSLVGDGEFPAFRRWAAAYVGDETARQCLPSRDQLVATFSARKEMYGAREPRLLCASDSWFRVCA
ncbi:hypothetical protein ACP4OV_019452 [Aristida adscensionis]